MYLYVLLWYVNQYTDRDEDIQEIFAGLIIHHKKEAYIGCLIQLNQVDQGNARNKVCERKSKETFGNRWDRERVNICLSLNIKGKTRFRGWLLQKVCSGFTCMALYLSKAWSHNLAWIQVYLATYLWYTSTVTTNRSLYRMLWKSS